MKFVLQWHITEKCNFRCKHCYLKKYQDPGPDISKLIEIYNQFNEINSNFFWVNFTKKRINFVGWEPFLRDDFITLLEYINKNTKHKLYIWILTNWSLLTQEKLNKLKNLKNLIINFQISLEWTKKINDEIRWKWSFEIIKKSILLCKKNQFNIHLSFTLNKLNINEVFNLLPFIESHNINLKIRRFVSMWNWKQNLKNLELSAKEFYEFTIKVFKTNLILKNWKLDLSWCSEVTWYKYASDWCWVNHHRLLVINHNLDVYSCRRLEIKLWNLNKNNLSEIFFENKYKNIIESYKKIDICKKCSIFNKCLWWAKCITYAKYNKLNFADPWCYKAELLTQKK